MTEENRQEQARQAFLVDTLRKLLGQDSPTGFTEHVVTVAQEIAQKQGFATRRTNKGNLVITVPGRETGRKVGLCAHVDTLGLMVRSITADGMLMVTKVGGPLLPTLDGEYCRIYTREGKVYTGTVLSLSPSVHVQDDAATRPRDEKNMTVRIDEKVHSKEDVQALGIAAGDYVCYDPKTIITDSGFVKSRFLDDKASAACLLTLLWQMRETGTRPRFDTCFTLTVHEEVGHGGATLPTVDELLAVDMGCVGEDLSCTEYQVSICAKDSGGPYDYGMVSRLVELAKAQGVDYAVDIYPHYGSDAEAAWGAGIDCRAALIGPGVHASHGMERTHLDALNATLNLAALYLELA
ncbi:MAG: M42 family metallopeptidase [Gemmiger sp.]|uniref:M42 family metallopeptidase n=1 Tax=Gemmiger sp. TaxID=2049027 RepID=UPI002E766F69|nr:M42 family metallopeptidase [Gemmiger sp.]MEE0800363.1 M42 family metallopeptidase [Gemmiger sp.]